jgi:hypothetical protein
VPNKEPVKPSVAIMDPVTTKLPVITADPLKGNPVPLPPPEPVFTVIGNVDPSPLVNVIVFNETEAVITALGVNEAVLAREAVVAKEELSTIIELVCEFNTYGANIEAVTLFCTYPCTNDAVVAKLLLTAWLAVIE